MSPSNAKRMNELSRMTPTERDESIVREMLGPLFDSFFGSTLPAYDRVLAETRKQEAENGLLCEEPGDCFVCDEDREPSMEVSLTDDIPDRYFAGIAMPNPISQRDEE